ncbi:pyrroline-5-carboxylate reductase dimerization domain-containing protein [Oerskovia sp. M15]
MALPSRIVIVGCGHMGLAIAQGLLRSEAPPEVVAVERDAGRRALLSGVDGLTVTEVFAPAAADFVVLAIPPQDFAQFAAENGSLFGRTQATMSVMAGITTASIAEALGTDELVRAIPNTPSEVFGGMTVYYALPAASSVVEATESLLRSIGKALRVQREDLVDDATAICGGGRRSSAISPTPSVSSRSPVGFQLLRAEMATQVFTGSATLIAGSAKTPMQLCREVMTAGGTTERAIAVFDAAEVKTTISSALEASARRSRELAGLLADAVPSA